MNTVDRRKCLIGVVLTICLIVIGLPQLVLAKSKAITPADIRYSEPFEVTATIMEIDYGKNLLIVAEREIYLVDLLTVKQAIKTKLSAANGQTILFDALERGQKVRVSGLQLPDGRVIAGELVLQSSDK